MCIIIFINYSKGHKIEKDVIVKEVIPNKDKTVVSITLDNGDIIKAYKTYSAHFRDRFTYNTYTLGGVFEYVDLQKLHNKFYEKDIQCDSLKNCLGEIRIDSLVKAIEGVSLEEYAAEIRKNAKLYLSGT